MSGDEKIHFGNGPSLNKPKFLQAETLAKIKKFLGCIGLLAVLIIYTLFGGLVFRKLELPAESERLSAVKTTLLFKRQELIYSINSTHITNLAEWEEIILRPYELAVQDAAKSGFSMGNLPRIKDVYENRQDVIENDRWSILQAIFFASTILTTIGYGNIFPSTFPGRLFCIVFALIGIPLTLTVIAVSGECLADGVSIIGLKVHSKLPKGLFKACIPKNRYLKNSLGALGAVLLLFLYLALGAAVFMLWETDWTFFEGFYFCFITMTTVGFGDIVPTNTKYANMLFCTGYILVGLALTSTIIELVRRQYVSSWERLQALSGPFGDFLKKFGENTGGDISVLQTDFKRALKVISMPRRRKSGEGGEMDEAIEALFSDIAKNMNHDKNNSEPRKSIIIIYETSV